MQGAICFLEEKAMKRDRENTPENIKILLKLMEWDKLSDRESDLLESFDHFIQINRLSDRQFEILNEIFDRANSR